MSDPTLFMSTPPEPDYILAGLIAVMPIAGILLLVWVGYYISMLIRYRREIKAVPSRKRWAIFFPSFFIIALITYIQLKNEYTTEAFVPVIISLIAYLVIFFLKKSDFKQDALVYKEILRPTAIAFVIFICLITTVFGAYNVMKMRDASKKGYYNGLES